MRSHFRNIGRHEVAPIYLPACGNLQHPPQPGLTQGQSWFLNQSRLCPGSGCLGSAAGRGCNICLGQRCGQDSSQHWDPLQCGDAGSEHHLGAWAGGRRTRMGPVGPTSLWCWVWDIGFVVLHKMKENNLMSALWCYIFNNILNFEYCSNYKVDYWRQINILYALFKYTIIITELLYIFISIF